jgi:uncharacterized protein YigA (DUF484 family)
MTIKMTDKDVADYLAANPDFFAEREKLAMKMELPHGSRGTVSLVEKQVAVMRDRQQKARKQLNEFITSAEQNKEIYDKSRSLVLELLSANRSVDFFAALEKGLKRDFKCKAYSLIVFGKRPRQINHFTSRVTADSAREFVGPLMRSREPVLGVLRSHEQDFLFRHQSEKVKSAAVLPVRQRNKQLALLAFGSSDPAYFSPDMDTLFIGFIAETLSRLLPRHLPR